MVKKIGPGAGRGSSCECGDHAWAGIGRGLVTLVSPQDAFWLDQQFWCAAGAGPKYYAMGAIKRKMVLLHRVIMSAAKGQFVDHANRNKMDNRRSNLRFVTRSQNSINRGHRADYRGVRLEDGKWRASIGVNRKNIKLGRFDTPEAAAAAYNEAAKKLHGQFAVLNMV